MSLSASARTLARAPGFLAPKPTEGRQKILFEVVGLDNPLMRPMPNAGLGLRGEIEHVAQCLRHAVRGRDIDKESRGARLDLIKESADSGGHHDRPLFSCP